MDECERPPEISPRVLGDAMARLEADGFIAYPTETVWGLGAAADRPRAIDRLLDWKGRAADAPLAVLVASAAHAADLGCRIENAAARLVEAFWPGPLTLVVGCQGRFAPGVARSDGALGLRCSSHPLAQALARAVEQRALGPLTSTSFNRTGEPAAETVDEASALLSDRARGDLESPHLVYAVGLEAHGAMPSSVVDCTGEAPRILREGAIDRAALEKALRP